MKLSMESYNLVLNFGAYEGFKLIKEAGFDCVDMSYYYQKEGSPLIGEEYREYAFQLRSYLDELGLVCNQAHAPFDFKHGEPLDISSPNYLAIVRSIESASIVGAKQIVVHSICVKKAGQLCFDHAYNLAYFKSLEPFCKKFNIKIAVENLFVLDNKRNSYIGRLGTPNELCEFVRELDSPYFVACVDVGHAAMTDGEPEEFLAGMVEESEHQRRQISLTRIGRAENHTGEGHIAPGIAHSLGEHGHITQRKLRPRQTAKHATQHRR